MAKSLCSIDDQGKDFEFALSCPKRGDCFWWDCVENCHLRCLNSEIGDDGCVNFETEADVTGGLPR